MALIVEDGSIVLNANTYVDAATVRAFSLLRGTDLSAVTDETLEPYIIKAMDYVESFRDKFKGRRWTRDQALQWPRSYVVIDNYRVYTDTIPQQLKDAVCQLTIDQNNGTDIDPDGEGQEVVREKIGPIETEFAKKGSTTVRTQLNRAHRFLKPLLRNGGAFLGRVTRG